MLSPNKKMKMKGHTLGIHLPSLTSSWFPSNGIQIPGKFLYSYY